MNKNELKKTIVSSYESVTPNVLDRIKIVCANETQEIPMAMPAPSRKTFATPQVIVAFASFILVFFVGIMMGKLVLNDKPERIQDSFIEPSQIATVFIDVNPSIELTVNENMRVMECIATNEDANKIINDMELEGVMIHTALNAIIGSMYMNGYLQGDTSAMLVSVDTDVDGFLEDITKDVNQIFAESSVNCDIISLSIEIEEVIDLANANGISAGKMGLVELIVESSSDYTESDIGDLSKLNILSLKNILDIINGIVPSTDDVSMIEDTIDEVINNAGELVSDIAEEVITDTTDMVDGVITDVTGEISDVVSDVTGEINEVVNDVLGEVNNVTGDVIDGVGDLIYDTLDGINGIINGATNEISNTISGVTDELIGNLPNLFFFR